MTGRSPGVMCSNNAAERSMRGVGMRSIEVLNSTARYREACSSTLCEVNWGVPLFPPGGGKFLPLLRSSSHPSNIFWIHAGLFAMNCLNHVPLCSTYWGTSVHVDGFFPTSPLCFITNSNRSQLVRPMLAATKCTKHDYHCYSSTTAHSDLHFWRMDGHTKPLVLASDNGSKVRFTAQQHNGTWDHARNVHSPMFSLGYQPFLPFPPSGPLLCPWWSQPPLFLASKWSLLVIIVFTLLLSMRAVWMWTISRKGHESARRRRGRGDLQGGGHKVGVVPLKSKSLAFCILMPTSLY